MKTEELRKIKELEGIDIPNFEEFNGPQDFMKRNMEKYFPEFCKYLNENYKYINEWGIKLRYFRKGIKEEEIHSTQNINGIELLIPNFNFYHLGNSKEEVLRKRYPQFCNFLDIFYHYIDSFREKIVLFKTNKLLPPQCPICGKHVEYIVSEHTYRKYCSKECENIGSVVVMKQTKKERYGDENYCNVEQIQKTFISNYNGVKNSSLVPEIRKRITENTRRFFIKDNEDWLIGYTDKGEYICKCPHLNECPRKKISKNCPKYFIIPKKTKRMRTKHGDELCTKINPLFNCYESIQERTIQNMLKSLNINIVPHNWELIKSFNDKKREIDIFLPDYNIGIEINGSYVHSISYYNGGKIFDHFEKRIQCENKGVELIYIWEDWNKEDVFNFLKDKLEGNDLTKYKNLWFPDLKENEWPLDLGKIDKEGIVNIHFCMHDKFLCIDSGILITPS